VFVSVGYIPSGNERSQSSVEDMVHDTLKGWL
jgi:hypothetical protein